MEIELPQEMENRIVSISDEELDFRGWTRESMREGYRKRLADDINSPQIGDKAPDFQLEKLGAKGERTGEYLALSSLQGKPLGLIFGSYT